MMKAIKRFIFWKTPLWKLILPPNRTFKERVINYLLSTEINEIQHGYLGEFNLNNWNKMVENHKQNILKILGMFRMISIHAAVQIKCERLALTSDEEVKKMLVDVINKMYEGKDNAE